MGCHTWYYKPIKIKCPNKHELRNSIIESYKRWYWENVIDDKFRLSIVLDNYGIDSIEELNSDIIKLQTVIYKNDNEVSDSINWVKRASYKEIINNCNCPLLTEESSDILEYHKNKLYKSYSGDHIFRVYGYPERNNELISIRSFKAFRRFLIKSYENSRLPKEDRKCNYGVIYKIPTKGEWKRIKSYCKGNFILEFG